MLVQVKASKLDRPLRQREVDAGRREEGRLDGLRLHLCDERRNRVRRIPAGPRAKRREGGDRLRKRSELRASIMLWAVAGRRVYTAAAWYQAAAALGRC